MNWKKDAPGGAKCKLQRTENYNKPEVKKKSLGNMGNKGLWKKEKVGLQIAYKLCTF